MKNYSEELELLDTILKLSQEAKDYIAEKGFDKQYGARPLNRAIQKYIEDALAEEIITSHISEGDKIFMDFDEEKKELTIKVEKAKKETESLKILNKEFNKTKQPVKLDHRLFLFSCALLSRIFDHILPSYNLLPEDRIR